MTLHSLSNYPSARTYVLKLHRDAAPAQWHLVGRLEHIASGDHFDFSNGEDLLAWLVQRAADGDPTQGDMT